MQPTLTLDSIRRFLEGDGEELSRYLGPQLVRHDGRPVWTVRAFLPRTKQAWVVDPAHRTHWPMRHLHTSGFFEACLPWTTDERPADYLLKVADEQGQVHTMQDPYAFRPWLTDYDLYLHGEGTHWRIYDKLGARPRCVDGVAGINFAVWAPNARDVSVVGDFNEWETRRHPMRQHAQAGIWELFIPGVGPGTKYKFRVTTCHGQIVDKSDPYGLAAELPPRTASIVADLEHFQWQDDAWLEARARRDFLHAPMSVYEVHLGSWRRSTTGHGWLNYRDLAHQLVDYCRAQGHTHIELLPVAEHPYSGSWGYQTVGYYAVTSRHGTPEDFMYFVDYCHRHGIGVIIDWVPAHFPKDGHGLARFDGTALYEHEDRRLGEHPDWGTLIFNYGRNEVRNFLVANALFWFDRYHVDGLRVDAVASMLYLDYSREEGQWVPNRYGGRENLEAIEFLKTFNRETHGAFPGILTIAEESTAWPGVTRPVDAGGLGFSLKWNMGWMNDTLRYFRHDPIHRSHHHDELTFSLIYAFHENFILPLSHDEVVHGKRSLLDQMPGDLWQKFANLRLLYSYMWTHPGKKLIFMGDEIAQWTEWSHDGSVDWDLLQWDTHRGIQRLVADLNRLHVAEPALHDLDFDGDGFEWLDCHSRADSVLAYLRRDRDQRQMLVVCHNFTPVVRREHRVGVPHPGWYREIFNSDSELYGGSNVGNFPGIAASDAPHHGHPWSITLQLPPLACCIFRWEG